MTHHGVAPWVELWQCLHIASGNDPSGATKEQIMKNTVKPNKTFKIKLHSTVEDALKFANRENFGEGFDVSWEIKNAQPGTVTPGHGEVLACFTCNELVYDDSKKSLRVFYVFKCEDGVTLINELTLHSCISNQPLRVVFPDLERRRIIVTDLFIDKDREGRKWFASVNGVAGTDEIHI